jgi:dihydrodipicolinate synthase/N-acetylneuraminate lyase
MDSEVAIRCQRALNPAVQTTPITYADLRSSVISVPPLARKADFTLNDAENTKLIRHLEAGGVRTFLYGGNANLYNIAVSEYGALLDYLEGAVAASSLVVPSVGPFYGTMMDQAAILRDRAFPTAMLLPTLFPAKESGIQTAVRHLVEKMGKPAVIYLKDKGYLSPKAAAQLVDEGLISWIKYAVVEPDPAVDPFLTELIGLVDRKLIVSGIGEQPSIVHLRDFGITGFTAGCVCVAPKLSMQMMNAIHSEQWAEAERLRQIFSALEDQRNTHGPIPVLHHAVTHAGIGDMGPMLPLMSAALPDGLQDGIRKAAVELLAANAAA